MHACEVVIVHFVFGSQTCGVEATKTIEDPWGYKDEVYICDEHFAKDVMLRRPYPMKKALRRPSTLLVLALLMIAA